MENEEWIELFESLVMHRFKTIEDINLHIEKGLGFNPQLEKRVLEQGVNDDFEKDLDNSLISNCTINGEDMCYLDVYYLNDNAGNMYITEVGYDFNT